MTRIFGLRTLVIVGVSFLSFGTLQSLADWDGDKRLDLIGIKRNGPNGKVEVHAMLQADGYKSFANSYTTPIPAPAVGWDFIVCYWDTDKMPDLIGIKRNGPNGKVEIHVMLQADGYKSFANSYTTPIQSPGNGWEFRVGYWDSDRLPDLIGIRRDGPNGKVEVHAMLQSDGYKSIANSYTTPIPSPAVGWNFEINYWDTDKMPDLIGIKRDGPNGKVELHAMLQADGYKSIANSYTTPILSPSDGWTFRVGNWDNDRLPDLIGIKRDGPNGKVELHAMLQADGYKSIANSYTTSIDSPGDGWDFLAANSVWEQLAGLLGGVHFECRDIRICIGDCRNTGDNHNNDRAKSKPETGPSQAKGDTGGKGGKDKGDKGGKDKGDKGGKEKR